MEKILTRNRKRYLIPSRSFEKRGINVLDSALIDMAVRADVLKDQMTLSIKNISAQCSKGVKLTKLGIQILVLQRGVYIISDSQELKFLKLVIRKCIFYGPEVWCFTPF